MVLSLLLGNVYDHDHDYDYDYDYDSGRKPSIKTISS